MENITNKKFLIERALFSSKDVVVSGCSFDVGESPLKESRNIEVKHSTFMWKYPLWYCRNAYLHDSIIKETARSGFWYDEYLTVKKCTIEAPKSFRYCKKLLVQDCSFERAAETFWNCDDVHIISVKAKGDYLGFHSKNVTVENLELYGNYLFDSCENVTVRNSYIESKDAFWNCQNVTLINCTIIGEYLGWNTKNLTLINCKITSHQGLCYIDGLTMHNCEMYNSDLTFEYCHNIDAEIMTVVDSIKNPYDGKIVVKDVKELILDKKFIDLSKIKIYKR